MAKRDREAEVEFEVLEPVEAAPVAEVTHVFTQVPRDKTYPFALWAKMRSKPEKHLRGMKAFLGNKASNRYSMETWDDLLKAY